MPQYYNHNDWMFLGKIKIIPIPWYRRINPIKNFLPYFVGDKIKFRLQIEKPTTYFWLYERFGEEYRSLDFLENDKAIEGSIINREGDVEYLIGFSGIPQAGEIRGTRTRLVGDSLEKGFFGVPRDTLPIFTTQVINKDRWSLGCVLILITALVTLCLGFINVIPHWNIWIPDWVTKWIQQLW